MIPIHLRTVLIIALVCYFVLILLFLKRKEISLKYTLLWIFAGIALGLLVIYPGILSWLVAQLGIQSNMNGLYVMTIGFIVAILMSITSIVSKQSEKIRLLSQTVALLEKRIRELENEKKKIFRR